MNWRRHTLRATIYAAVLCAAAYYLNPDRLARQQYIEENKLNKEERELNITVAPEFKEKVKQVIDNLVTQKNYTVIRGASWCGPCKKLEVEIEKKGLEDKIEAIIDTETEEEGMYFRQEMQKKGIIVPKAIPSITQHNNKKIESTYGIYEEGMTNEKQTITPLEQIIQ